MALRAAMKALATIPTMSRITAVARVAPRGARLASASARPSPRLYRPRILIASSSAPRRAVGLARAASASVSRRARPSTMTPHLRSTRTPSRYARAQHHPDPPTSDPSGHPRDKMFSPAHPSSRIGHARAGQARDAGVLERRSGRLLGPGVRRCRSRPRIAPGLRTPHRLRPLFATNGRAEFAHPERTRAVARPGPRRGSPHASHSHPSRKRGTR